MFIITNTIFFENIKLLLFLVRKSQRINFVVTFDFFPPPYPTPANHGHMSQHCPATFVPISPHQIQSFSIVFFVLSFTNTAVINSQKNDFCLWEINRNNDNILLHVSRDISCNTWRYRLCNTVPYLVLAMKARECMCSR